MLGNIYKRDSKRVKVKSKTGKIFKCIEWFNGSSREIELNINQLNSLEYICTLKKTNDMENTLEVVAENELEPVTRELILSKLEEVRATIETKEIWIDKKDKRFRQMEVLEIDILKGNKVRLEQALIHNHFEEIN